MPYPIPTTSLQYQTSLHIQNSFKQPYPCCDPTHGLSPQQFHTALISQKIILDIVLIVIIGLWYSGMFLKELTLRKFGRKKVVEICSWSAVGVSGSGMGQVKASRYMWLLLPWPGDSGHNCRPTLLLSLSSPTPSITWKDIPPPLSSPEKRTLLKGRRISVEQSLTGIP